MLWQHENKPAHTPAQISGCKVLAESRGDLAGSTSEAIVTRKLESTSVSSSMQLVKIRAHRLQTIGPDHPVKGFREF